ncbi:rhamnogalacturonyl hydrolase YesR [Rhizomicrobium palustre]|uniref:Rhamnogalacturonyl hydrolase YesR n=1 Tax=Rhizomicrobium palustre TaxID=189966 RepID=A0A846N1Y2_9PROT|nr:glycoside hydrolase family 88 protein [Rhizomicrobium palustre]NIK89120.1 rhamnogalacturonyl hydrolase YesR [Rhizomicrobium palustre]
MKKLILALALGVMSAASAEPLPDPQTVLATLDRASAAEIKSMRESAMPMNGVNAPKEISAGWVSAAYYVGAAKLARVTKDPTTLNFLSEVAGHFNYALTGATTMTGMLHADNVAMGDLYEELYARRREPGTLLPLRQRLDFQLPHLTRQPEPEKLVWWWCDALFMAPPVLARMSALTGDSGYLGAMDVQWWRTTEKLYDRDEHLMYRDERFIGKKSDSGKKIFWSRGDGWVMAGTARVLESMPADFASRPRYVKLFQEMAEKIATLQRPDGLWTTNLLDPKAAPEGETSGTGFYTYALAFGINHGILERKKYLPHVLKGWAALNAHLLPSGLLGSVQKIGDRPVPPAPEDTAPYAQGAFILAGLEVMKLGEPISALPIAEPNGDLSKPQTADPLSYDPAKASGGTLPRMAFQLAPPKQGEDKPAAIVRYAPYRYDDILWENDRIAHRLYGPALEKYEPPSGSGIDIWGKRVRYPFMERQLATGHQHDFHGDGLDFYNVGAARGDGGLGIWYANKLWTSRNYRSFKILNPGPEVASFSLEYAPWPVDVVRKVWEHRELSLPLGTNFTKQVSTISSDDPSELVVGIGINKKATSDKAGDYSWDATSGKLVVWEKTDPDKGTMGLALMVDPAQVAGFVQDAENFLVLVKVTPGKPFTYYSGGCWDKGLDFHSRGEWEEYVKAQKPVFP